MGNDIAVRGVSENHLRSVDADIPHGRITVITGVLLRHGVEKLGSNLTLLYYGY
jgi:excinuclease UvrABC ATPase subunit